MALRKSQFLIGALSLVFVLFITYLVYLSSPASSEAEEVRITISQGSGLNEIAKILKSQGLIRSESLFKIYCFLSGSAHMLKSGDYVLAKNLSLVELTKKLVQGPPDLKILVTEGQSLKDIAGELIRLGLLTHGALEEILPLVLEGQYPFLKKRKTLEGFLFPDTYFISPSASEEEIIKKFLDNFKIKALPTLAGGDEFSDASYHDLIIASLIEREIPLKEDRPLVAGILKKRLSIGMPLQVDATVLYVKCGGRFDPVRGRPVAGGDTATAASGRPASNGVDACPPLTKDDFKLKSAYNTYYFKELPPGPIANPGANAILAARNPQKSDFLYYLSDPETKKTVFSKTLEEHNRARARYLSSGK